MVGSRRRAGLACAVASALALTGAFTAAASAAVSASTCRNWTGGPPPGPGTRANVLLGVTVLAPCNAWAVGYQSGTGTVSTLIEHWNGSTWAVMPSPNPGTGIVDLLRSVRGISPTDIWAVGSFSDGNGDQTLIVHWNGKTWQQVQSPDPGGSSGSDLDGVRAVSSKDAWAVGSYLAGTGDKTLILHWNGNAWKQIASPTPGGDATLSAVTATSSGNAWAVGRAFRSTGDASLILHWNGTAWKQVASPNPGASNDITAVAASSKSDAWAVGIATDNGIDQPLILRWNGRRWTHIASPDQGGSTNDNDLTGVTVVSGANAWAVGSVASGQHRQTLILHWNGARWAHVPSPNRGTANQLLGVSARSASNLWAVGTYFDGTAEQPLAIHCC